MFKPFVLFIFYSLSIQVLNAQSDSTVFINHISTDTTITKLSSDAIYNRPFLSVGKLPIAIGGYIEANSQYSQTDGISEGISFQMRRMTLFFSSTIANRIRFLAELEFEDGTREINLENAIIDIDLHPLLNLRGGIILNPIGSFNQNHDGPKWDFIDRPLEATTILAATLSNVGFGLHGKYFHNNWIFAYEAYLTNGFNDEIIANGQNRTSLSEGKSDPEKFEESNSGLPMYTGKVAVRNRNIGEIGISYMSGVFNKWKEDGFIFDEKRLATAIALDFNTSLFKNRINISAEVAQVSIEVPKGYSQAFGEKQWGAYIDIVGTILQKKMLGWENAKINLGVRLEYVDYNLGEFRETNGNIGDEITAIIPSIAFRPTSTIVLRFNYRFERQTDLLGNPPFRTGVIQFGFSSYF